MKTLVIYTSQTGFTQRYAEWIKEETSADVLDLKEAKRKKTDYFQSYDAILYGGWANAGKVTGAKWFFGKAASWTSKKLGLFVVGASPADNPEAKTLMDKAIPEEMKNKMQGFYLQGGLNYDRMSAGSRLAMKALLSIMNHKKNPTEKDKAMAEMISHSYDISDRKFIAPIVSYVNGGV